MKRDSFAGVPQAMRDAAHHEADLDLLARLLSGSFAYPAMLLFLGFTTPYRTDHPYLFWLAIAAIILALLVRLAVGKFREQLLSRNRRLFLAALTLSLVLCGGTAGFVFLTIAMKYGFASWPFSLTVLWMAGITSGSTISFQPNFTLLLIQLTLLLGPLVCYQCLLGTTQGATIGLATLVFLGFNAVLGRRLNTMYWDLSASSALEKLRIRELETANSVAEHAHQKLQYHATHDALTSMMNRARILTVFEEELERSLHTDAPLGVVMFDLDNFKRINDKYGHMGGDEVLRTVAARVRQSIRSSDAVGRYGGEEFLILLPGCDAEKCAANAERVRQAIESEPVIHGRSPIKVTASFGVAVFDPSAESGDLHLLAKADTALYRAKRRGKNRIEIDSFDSSMVPVLIQRALMRA